MFLRPPEVLLNALSRNPSVAARRRWRGYGKPARIQDDRQAPDAHLCAQVHRRHWNRPQAREGKSKAPRRVHPPPLVQGAGSQGVLDSGLRGRLGLAAREPPLGPQADPDEHQLDGHLDGDGDGCGDRRASTVMLAAVPTKAPDAPLVVGASQAPEAW